jgi:hypothetical protein
VFAAERLFEYNADALFGLQEVMHARLTHSLKSGSEVLHATK